MIRSDDVLDLIERIYEAATTPAAWGAFLERCTDVVGGLSSTLLRQDVSTHTVPVAIADRVDPHFHALYERHYASVNVWITHDPGLMQLGRICTSDEMCPREVVLGSEFYADWLRPQGILHGLGGMIHRESSVSTFLTTFRAKARGQFGADHVRLYRVLVPHLQRAFQVNDRLGAARLTRDLSAAVLDRLAVGVVVLSERGAPLLVNAAAQAIFAQGDGLTLHRDGIHAERPDEERKLRRLVAAALRPSSDEEPPVDGALRITRPSLQRPFPMLVSRLRAGRHQLGGRYAAAVVFVSDPEAEIDAVEEVLTGFYGMTAAESAVARLLVQGRRVEEVAARLRISTNTVRTHLKRAFGKTGSAGQTDLVRLLLGSPAHLRGAARGAARGPGSS